MAVSFIFIYFFEEKNCLSQEISGERLIIATSHGCNGKYMKYGNFPWTPVMAAYEPMRLALVLHNNGTD